VTGRGDKQNANTEMRENKSSERCALDIDINTHLSSVSLFIVARNHKIMHVTIATIYFFFLAHPHADRDRKRL
jgi:hypothetical protein